MLVSHENVALHVVFSLLQGGALLAKIGSLLLELGQLSAQLSQSNVFLTSIAVICVAKVAIQELLVLRYLALIDFSSDAFEF